MVAVTGGCGREGGRAAGKLSADPTGVRGETEDVATGATADTEGSSVLAGGAGPSPRPRTSSRATTTSVPSETVPPNAIHGSIECRRGKAVETVVARTWGREEIGGAWVGSGSSATAAAPVDRAGTTGISIVAPKSTDGCSVGVAFLAGISCGPAA
jgi:hypothetical protein